MNKLIIRSIAVIMLFSFHTAISRCQTSVPEVLFKGSLSEQFLYLEEKTRIYENYRAIREDMFQLIKENSTDSLAEARDKTYEYITLSNNLSMKIDSLQATLSNTTGDLKEMTRTKNSIKIIGISINKYAYNTIMFIIVAGLCFMLITGFIAYKRNLSVTSGIRKELVNLNDEFEAYRKKSRLEREKMSLDHFNEIKRLKGK